MWRVSRMGQGVARRVQKPSTKGRRTLVCTPFFIFTVTFDFNSKERYNRGLKCVLAANLFGLPGIRGLCLLHQSRVSYHFGDELQGCKVGTAKASDLPRRSGFGLDCRTRLQVDGKGEDLDDVFMHQSFLHPSQSSKRQYELKHNLL
jgi:hypothetical protein